MAALIHRAEQNLRTGVQRIRRLRGERDRGDPRVAVFHFRGARAVARHRPRRHVLHLAGARIPARNAAAEARAIDDVRIGRIRQVVVALVAADRMPVAERERAIVAAAGDADRAGILLARVDPVREAVVGGEVIELAGRLVVPVAPVAAAVDTDHGTLVAGGDHAFGMFRVDPEVMVVIATRCALDDREGLASVARAMDRLTDRVEHIGIAGRDGQAALVPGADCFRVVDLLPARAAVVGAVQAAMIGGINRRVDACRVAREMRDRETDAAEFAGRPAFAGETLPGDSVIQRLVDRAAVAFDRREVAEPRPVARLPCGSENNIRLRGIGGEIDDAGVVVDEQRLRPALAAIGRAEHAALGIGAEDVTKRADQHGVRILSVDENRADMPRRGQPGVLPVRSAVGGSVQAVASRDVVARLGMTAAGIKHVRLRWRDSNCTDRRRGESVRHRLPGRACVAGLPHAATGRTEVERIGLIRNAGRHRAPTGAERAEQTPFEAGELRVRNRLRECARRGCHREQHQRERKSRGMAKTLMHGRPLTIRHKRRNDTPEIAHGVLREPSSLGGWGRACNAPKTAKHRFCGTPQPRTQRSLCRSTGKRCKRRSRDRSLVLPGVALPLQRDAAALAHDQHRDFQ